MMELLGIIKNEKNNLQKLLEELQGRLYEIQLKIGEEAAEIWTFICIIIITQSMQ